VTWQPPPRPDWVIAVNEGLVLPLADEAAAPLDRDALLAEALVRAGHPPGDTAAFGVGATAPDALLDALDVLLPALEGEARLTLLGRWITRRFLLRLLEVRLHLAGYVRADPGVRDEVIEEPLVVTGAPRTGTTILHALLARDPGVRVPEGWELLRPVPPPDPATDVDPRIALADRELRLPALVVSGLDAIHAYSGRMPKECLSAMSFEARSEEFTARYSVPSYAAWLHRCDMRPAYEMHRLVLQVLQRRTPGTRWVLKSPVHLHSLPTLLAVYPDARVAVTHRDPLTVLGSVSSLVATLRWAHSDHVDMADIGRYHADLYHADLDGLVDRVDDGTLDPARVHHGHYADFMNDPLAAVRALHRHLGRPLDAATVDAMRRHLDERPQGLHGEHRYDFADLGLDRIAEHARFARYRARFAVPEE
jgi:hypothetical protein